MGIYFHVLDYDCKARWSYTGFHRFRKRVAESLGLTLEIDSNFKWVQQDWGKWDKDWLIFLTHSDCDGIFTFSQCARISKKLRCVLEKWEPKDIQHVYDLEHGVNLVEAMEYCKINKKNMKLS
ncbi:MAG TPA: hypothetical protein VHZ50_16470 [Puia sp.]|jgi:hypothetical protein|nr:hypothetical protein [Puia sp.]